jgi:hypothetical protein
MQGATVVVDDQFETADAGSFTRRQTPCTKPSAPHLPGSRRFAVLIVKVKRGVPLSGRGYVGTASQTA